MKRWKEGIKNMGNQRDRQFTLPKNIRQMGQFGDTYKIYVEDFVYTYVHRTLHMEKQEHEIAAAVLLGKTCRRNNQEYIFISGAQQVSFSEWGQADETDSMYRFTENNMAVLKSDAELNSKPNAELNSKPDMEFGMQEEGTVYQTEEPMYDVPVSAIASQDRQQQFWEKVYQGIKEYFSNLELLGWYFNLDGDNLEISASMQQFFDATEEHGSKFLYFEDKLNRQDAFFVQEQHSLQRVEGYAVYYEKNPSMQEFLVAQNRHTEPPRVEGEGVVANREDVAQNYRAILNKLNEKPAKKKRQPFVYVAGVAVLAVVAATGITQVGNYQNLKTLQQTLQTVSGNVQGKQDAKKTSATDQKETAKAGDEKTNGQSSEASSDGKKETGEQNTAQSGETTDAAQTASENTSGNQDADQNTDTQADQSTNQNVDTKTDQGTTQNTDAQAGQNQENQGAQGQDTQSQQTSAQDVRHYTVKKGDSLMSISKAIYHDTSMIDKICSMNQIENMDMIYEGQDLILP